MDNPSLTLLEYLRRVSVGLDGAFLGQGARLQAQLAIEFGAESDWGLSPPAVVKPYSINEAPSEAGLGYRGR